MGKRSGDDKAIPLCSDHHTALHTDGNELRWLAVHKIHGMGLAAALWASTGDESKCLDILKGMNDGD